MKTADEIAKFRKEVLEGLATASADNFKWLQGCIFGLDYPSTEEKVEKNE